MIEKLEMRYIGLAIVAPPDGSDLMKKINELVEAINRLESQIEKLQVQ